MDQSSLNLKYKDGITGNQSMTFSRRKISEKDTGLSIGEILIILFADKGGWA